MELQLRFESLLKKHTSNSLLISDLWNRLHSKYAEKHRTYHNLTHLKELFSYFDMYHDSLKYPDSICFSIFYHDVIYSVIKKDNEERSADFAIDALSDFISDKDLLTKIHQQIIATKTHNSEDIDTQFLLDFDLAILGQSFEKYSEYSQLIRKEYKLIPDFMYKKGRAKVLKHFIEKPFIYKTPEFIEQFEQQAKSNLQQELKQLR